MMDDTIPEVIITSSDVCSIYDATNSNEIVSYKADNSYSPKTLSLIGEDFLIAAVSNQPLLKVWTVSKSRKHETRTFVVPGKVSVLAVSKCGNYCIAGIKERIYIWEVSTGDLMMILRRHYQAITCLKFTADDSHFFSGGKDGLVMVWILSCVIDVNARFDTVKPHFVWKKHSAEITDIYCGLSVSRVATTSLDMTCNVYELDSGLLLTTICMDSPLTCVVMDPLEYFIFLGDESGYLYRINTYERLPHEIHRTDIKTKMALQLHDFKIISLSVSFDGALLLTVSEDSCKLWHIPSMGCVLSILPEGNLTNAFLAMKPGIDNTVVPNSHVQTFKKEMAPISEDRCVTAKLRRQELSLLHEGCPDKYFDSSLLHYGTESKKQEDYDTIMDSIFEEAIYGDSIRVVTKLNQQLFTIQVDNAITDTNPSSPS